MGGAIAGLPVSSKIKLLLGLRQALVEGGDGIDGVLVDLDEERMRDVHAWLESGGKLGEIDECVVALRRQAAAEVGSMNQVGHPCTSFELLSLPAWHHMFTLLLNGSSPTIGRIACSTSSCDFCRQQQDANRQHLVLQSAYVFPMPNSFRFPHLPAFFSRISPLPTPPCVPDSPPACPRPSHPSL